ncbi:MAG: FAD-dependent oxidoreductase [Kutzneria sp.]|nr:FAD-dependent oxidoreductase [Kutzneria sp.]MBV9846268.1 FAD-dependent oxidoreductase [Kutzneria sp.]
MSTLDVDVVVIGSGAAGLSAALAAANAGVEVAVVEAADRWGGSTAVSGGGVWAPANHRLAEAGIDDSVRDALTYCLDTSPGRDRGLVETFVRTAPEVIRFIEEHSPLRFAAVPSYPDTFAERPGGKIARHVEPRPLTTGDLGPLESLVWPPPFGAPVLTYEEILRYRLFSGGAPPIELVERRLAAGEVALGVALVVGLLRGVTALGVRLVNNCRVRELLRTPDGSITGALADRGDASWQLSARRGVVLACGGFEHDPALTAELLAGPLTHPVTPPVNRGDALRLAGKAGARLARTSEYWSWPAHQVPGEAWPDADTTPRPQLTMLERMLPHVLWVNASGRRFVNESSHNCAVAFAEVDPRTNQPRNVPAFAIGDAQFRDRYPVAGAVPGEPTPSWLVEADTLAELAEALGIEAARLAATVTRFNEFARAGRDEDFGRGQTRYEHALGDAAATHPNLGTVEVPPFFAMRVHPGAVGTKGGPLTDTRARVLGWDGEPIPGLYAAGNAMAAVFGPGTVAGGLTIASALVWGYLAGRDAADRQVG